MNTDSGTARKEARIAELDRIIQTEEAKPNPDYQLIDDCIREIGELEGAKVDFSEEEVAKATGKIIRKAEREKKRKRIVRYAAAAAAVVVLVGGVTACTVNPAMIDWIIMVTKLPFGNAIKQGDYIYTNKGDSISYNSVEELVANEGISIYYPQEMEKRVELIQIKKLYISNIVKYSFFYSDPDYSLTISEQTALDEKLLGEDKLIKTQAGDFYIYVKHDMVQSNFLYDAYFYSIICPNYEEMLKIIHSFKKVG